MNANLSLTPRFSEVTSPRSGRQHKDFHPGLGRKPQVEVAKRIQPAKRAKAPNFTNGPIHSSDGEPIVFPIIEIYRPLRGLTPFWPPIPGLTPRALCRHALRAFFHWLIRATEDLFVANRIIWQNLPIPSG